MIKEKVVGMDLGTTNSGVSVFDEEQGRPVMIPNAEGELLTDSAVAVTDGDIVVGGTAKRMAPVRPDEVATGFKRQMGVTTPDGRPTEVLSSGEKVYTPETLSGAVLKRLKDDGSEYLGWPITRAYITVPAYFADPGRQATKNAGQIAGLEVPRIINEPTAAAIAYGRKSGFNGHVAVADLGGGTFDISIMQIEGNVYTTLATAGDRQLGGDDFTNEIVQMGFEESEREHGFRPTPDEDAATLIDLIDKAERAKLDLTSRETTWFSFSCRGYEVRMEIKREAFEDRIRSKVERAVEITKRTIEAAGVPQDKLSLILVGGSTRVPLVRTLVSECLGLDPLKAGVEADYAVTLGAAIAAASEDIIEGEVEGGLAKVVLNDVTSHGLGVEIMDDDGHKVISTIIPENTQLPVERTQRYALEKDTQTTARIRVFQGKDGMSTDSPDAKFIGEVVARGLPPQLPREKRIEVTFAYDKDCVVVVGAVDLVSGKSTHGRLENRGGMTAEAVDEARREVEGSLTT